MAKENTIQYDVELNISFLLDGDFCCCYELVSYELKINIRITVRDGLYFHNQQHHIFSLECPSNLPKYHFCIELSLDPSNLQWVYSSHSTPIFRNSFKTKKTFHFKSNRRFMRFTSVFPAPYCPNLKCALHLKYKQLAVNINRQILYQCIDIYWQRSFERHVPHLSIHYFNYVPFAKSIINFDLV